MTTPQPPFSARHHDKHRQIDNDFPATGRNGLFHLLVDLVQQQYVGGWPAVATELQRIGRLPSVTYLSGSADSVKRAKQEAWEVLTALQWAKVYDFCERLYGHLAREVGYTWNDEYTMTTPKNEVQAYVAAELQRLFLEERVAFEFSDGIVRRRGRKHTVDVTSNAYVVLGDARLTAARKHYEKALQFFRNPSKPDYENAVKEAVCAVEAAGRSLFPSAKAKTLGDLATWLGTTNEVAVPKTLAQTFTAIYGYRNGGDGVSHGGARGGVATAEVAEYVLAVCASQIVYLVDVANALENEVPF